MQVMRVWDWKDDKQAALNHVKKTGSKLVRTFDWLFETESFQTCKLMEKL